MNGSKEAEMKENQTVKKNLILAQTAILSALIIVMTFVPYLGYISYGALSITLIHIPVIIGACLLGVKAGAALGAVWGVSCIIKAITAPPSPLEGIIFRNPLIALIPRILMGIAAGLVMYAVQKKSKVLGAVLASIAGCLTNTILVMGGIYLIYGEKYGDALNISSISFGGLTNYILTAFGINAVIEIAVAIIITVPVVKAIKPKLLGKQQ
jgi:uncharacterized membrane protein